MPLIKINTSMEGKEGKIMQRNLCLYPGNSSLFFLFLMSFKGYLDLLSNTEKI